MSRSFFVTVIAPTRRSLLKLREYGLDLFRPTAKVTERKEYTIDGLLTLEQVEHLVIDGYQVLVKEESSQKARGRTETVDFKEWIGGMKE